MIRTLVFFLSLAALFSPGQAVPGPDDILYLPENLKANVAFWESIYRTVKTSQGLVHDADSLRVVYETLETGPAERPHRNRIYGPRIDAVSALLKSMALTDRAQWSDEMKGLEQRWGRELSPVELLAAANRVRFQLGQSDRFLAGLKRSGRYLERIKATFREMGLPEELAFLPHVESSFNYRAYSKVGAAGIWQFMRGTGKMYMKVGYVVDERLDPVKSTRAAAKLLICNYRRLKSWPLAITAYNHGANSMAAAICQHGTTDIGVIVEKYERRSFQFASKNFYACFVAAYRTASNYRAYFGDIQFEPAFESAEIKLPRSYKPSQLSALLDLPIKTLQDYNLDIRPPAFKKNQPLPAGHVLNLPMFYASRDLSPLFGEPVAAVASPAPETPETFLVAEISPALEPDLTQPAAPPAPLAPITPLIRSARVKLAPPVVTKAAAPAPAPAPATVAAVKVSGIPTYLRAPRPEDSSALKADSLLTRWDYLTLASLNLNAKEKKGCEFCEFRPEVYGLDAVSYENGRMTVKVQAHETVGHYAEWAGISSDKIKRLNRLGKSIYLGKAVDIPIRGDSAVAAFKAARLFYHMGIEEDFFANYEVTALDTLQLKDGGSIWAVCLDNDIPLWLLMKINPQVRDWRLLRPQTLRLPEIAEKKVKGF